MNSTLFKDVNAAVAARARSILADWLPGGKFGNGSHGAYCYANNPVKGEKRHSLTVWLENGYWKDHANGDSGGDFVSLYAYLNSISSQFEAAKELAAKIGIQFQQNNSGAQNIRATKPKNGTVARFLSRPEAHATLGKPSRVWAYKNADGGDVFWVYRFDTGAGKEFRPLHFNGSAWKWSDPAGKLPLYRLPEILGNPGKPLLFCEGEKAADAAPAFFPDYIPTATAHGAQSPGKTDFAQVKGRDCLVWPDNDAPGLIYADKLAALLTENGAARVQILELPAGLPPKADAADMAGLGLSPGGWSKREASSKESSKEPKEPAQDDKPEIRITPGALDKEVILCDKIMATAGIYQRGGRLVRPVRVKEITGIEKIEGATGLLDINEHWLIHELTARINWKHYGKTKSEWVDSNCPALHARSFINLGEWDCPVISGVIESPTIRADGTLLTKPGYDSATGLFLDYSGEIPAIPDKPTRADALAALEILKEPFLDFPFVDYELDLSVVLAGVLSAISRRSIPSAPLIGFDAPKAGSGKSLLVDCISLIATGRTAAIISQSKEDGEDEKRLGSILLLGTAAVVSIDNVERPVSGDMLCSVLTQPAVNVRVLGESRMPSIPVCISLFATGNNLSFAGDMTRRVLLCRLDPETERPDARSFDVDLHAYIPKNRARLLAAALTILRAWVVSGETLDIVPFGSFEKWSGLVRSALVWLGMRDPLETRDRVLNVDPVSNTVQSVFSAWHSALGSSEVTAQEVIQSAVSNADLAAALLEVAANRRGDGLDARRLGIWLRKYARRIDGGFKLIDSRPGHGGKMLWKVVTVGLVGVVGVAVSIPRTNITHIDNIKYKNNIADSAKQSHQSNQSHQLKAKDGKTAIPLSMKLIAKLIKTGEVTKPEDVLCGERWINWGMPDDEVILGYYEDAVKAGLIPKNIDFEFRLGR